MTKLILNMKVAEVYRDNNVMFNFIIIQKNENHVVLSKYKIIIGHEQTQWWFMKGFMRG